MKMNITAFGIIHRSIWNGFFRHKFMPLKRPRHFDGTSISVRLSIFTSENVLHIEPFEIFNLKWFGFPRIDKKKKMDCFIFISKPILSRKTWFWGVKIKRSRCFRCTHVSINGHIGFQFIFDFICVFFMWNWLNQTFYFKRIAPAKEKKSFSDFHFKISKEINFVFETVVW